MLYSVNITVYRTGFFSVLFNESKIVQADIVLFTNQDMFVSKKKKTKKKRKEGKTGHSITMNSCMYPHFSYPDVYIKFYWYPYHSNAIVYKEILVSF